MAFVSLIFFSKRPIYISVRFTDSCVRALKRGHSIIKGQNAHGALVMLANYMHEISP